MQQFVAEKGPNSFYESVENRKQCCHIRKVEPLQRALKEKKVWITGIRAAHSPNRHDMKPLEYDEVNKVVKFHPLLNWTTDEVTGFINDNNIPYNPLHDKGFVSIGCAPCTREYAREKIFVQEDGGGKMQPIKNVDCMCMNQQVKR